MVIVTLGKNRIKTILSYDVQNKLLGKTNAPPKEYKKELLTRFTHDQSTQYLGAFLWKSANGHLVFEEWFESDIGCYVMRIKKERK